MKKYLLLGNGFTLNYYKFFSYDEMKIKMENSENSDYQIFCDLLDKDDYFQGNDFEKLMEYITYYNSNKIDQISEITKNYLTNLQGKFTTALRNIIAELNYEMKAVIDFMNLSSNKNNLFNVSKLNSFDTVYSLNFDELLDNLGLKCVFKYLHYNRFNENHIIGATGTSKLLSINNDDVLKSVWDEFSKIEGELHIFGASLTNSDRHLIDIINKNKAIQTIYYYIYEQDNLLELELTKSRIKLEINKKVKFKNSRFLIRDINDC